MIYFMRMSGGVWSDLVKIGYTKDEASLHRRQTTLQTGVPWKLEVIRTIEDAGQWMEAWFHRQFAHLRHKGEWFSYDPEMIDLIPDAATFIRNHNGIPEREALEALIESLIVLLDDLTPEPDAEPEADDEPHEDDEPDAEEYVLVKKGEVVFGPHDHAHHEDAEPANIVPAGEWEGFWRA